MTDMMTDLRAISPMLAVVAGGIVLLLIEAFLSGGVRRSRAFLAPLALGVYGLAALLVLHGLNDAGTSSLVFSGHMTVDRLGQLGWLVFLVGAALTSLLASGYMREHRFEFGEFHALVAFSTAGMMILSVATHMLTLFVGLELMSLAIYVLTGSWRRSHRSSEAAMKYFLVGAFATAILLYGIALLYGASGGTSFAVIASAGSRPQLSPLYTMGMLMVLVAFGFKVAAVPFHMWAADAYEGAPTPVTGFMAAGVKAAGFLTLYRLVSAAFGAKDLTFGAAGWGSVLAGLAVLTMTVGNLVALRQDNIKRLLAYSSIAHAGYLLVGVVAGSYVGPEARGPLYFYLRSYTFTTLGAFGVITWIGKRGDERLQLDDWSGLAWRHPAAALGMTIFMLSLAGFPPTAGFFGKFYVFRAALAKPGLMPLVLIAVLNSVVSAYYYLRVVTTMYFRDVERPPQPIRSAGIVAALVISAIATLALGLLPSGVVGLL